jgi:RNA polymerase sigma-70 factor (ECF subfamily)
MNASRPPPPNGLELHLRVLRAQSGDEAAFAQLFHAFAPKTLGYLRGLVGDEADDVQQEVWLTVYRQLAGLSDARVFRTWLYRLTRHKAIDHLRRLRRERNLFADEEELATVVDPAARAEEEVEALVPDALLEQLPPLQREAVLLRFRDQLSYAEIASIAGCSVGTVRSRLFYARQRLAALSKNLRTEP